MAKENNLKAFIVSFAITGNDAEHNDIKSVAITAYDKKEAGNIFIKWTQAKNIYERVNGVVVQQARKTKKNAHLFTIDFYKKQNAFVDDLKVKSGKADA